MSKNYSELNKDLENLLNDLSYETNPTMIGEIEAAIVAVKEDIENYDLSDDDLFECTSCKQIHDIEDSVNADGKLICTNCQ